MKTNTFWQCHYCDRKLSAKRKVLLHISTQHGANWDIPGMYSKTWVSPKDIKYLIQSSENNLEKLGPLKEKKDGQPAQEAIDNETEKLSDISDESVDTSESDKEDRELPNEVMVESTTGNLENTKN